MSDSVKEFSFRTREKALQRFESEVFDLLIVGGGITGAAVARDATSRGLSVALVERKDFAYGTSSRSSKLIHGGLRYLENLEFGLVFEALSERSLLLKTVPHLVKPLPFYLPVYRGDTNGLAILSLGLWLYDLLALFRAPGFHKRLSRQEMLKNIPFLKEKDLVGGFSYYDASMWDDVLAVETLRSAQNGGAAIANYVEAIEPTWEGERISGFRVRDLSQKNSKEITIRAHQTVICTGPWTDELGSKLSKNWNRWLTPSKGVHLIFDLKRIPIPAAMVMSHPEDGRIVFVIPRPDYGPGVVIVGTTDGPTPDNPDDAKVVQQDVKYIMNLLTQYFPDLRLNESDILSAYVGVRPLMGGQTSPGQGAASVLQKVSREHHIDEGPGGVVMIAGGKYTTHRKMGQEIVDFTLANWKKNCKRFPQLTPPQKVGASQTKAPVNPQATREATQKCENDAIQKGIQIPRELLSRYGADSLVIVESQKQKLSDNSDPEGFPFLEEQLRYCIQNEMVIHLEDFYLRRVPLFATRKDHGLPWAESLAQIWAKERNLSPAEAQLELARLQLEMKKRAEWSVS